MTIKEKALDGFRRWYDQLPTYAVSDGPAKGTIGGALVVLERLKAEYVLDIDAHTAKGGSQVSGASGAAVKKILERFGETRRFIAEGGRTNRGLRSDIISMLNTLESLGLDAVSGQERNEILDDLQRFLAGKVTEFHGRQRLRVVYDPSKSAWQFIHELLDVARERGAEGPVAEYLVGAKLALRFPDAEVRNGSYSAADEQSNLPGDFVVGDTAFHVTVAPMLPLFQKCKRNLEAGYRVYLLTREQSLFPTRASAASVGDARITVSSIESFVAQNVEELSTFSQDELSRELYLLLEVYNRRTEAVEIDRSMLIEIPENLLHCAPSE